MKELPYFATTAIGSVPYSDPAEAVSAMEALDIPAYPQMVQINPWEDMFLGALTGLPALVVDRENQKVRAKRNGRENDLADFYAKFMAGERDFLALTAESRLGLDSFLERARVDSSYGPDFLKVQVIGPITFGQMVPLEDERSTVVDDPELLEAMALALGGKAAGIANQIRDLGRTPVVFIDEPGLSSFGSAFSTLTADTVIETMRSASDVVRADGPALIGCHVCGNTDWAMLMDMGIDIVNFDAFEIMELFSLYPTQLRAFLEKGGLVAWGIVPSQGFSTDLKAKSLVDKMAAGFSNLDKKGVPVELLASRSLITTSCGLGTLSVEMAKAATDMLSCVSTELRVRYQLPHAD